MIEVVHSRGKIIVFQGAGDEPDIRDGYAELTPSDKLFGRVAGEVTPGFYNDFGKPIEVDK